MVHLLMNLFVWDSDGNLRYHSVSIGTIRVTGVTTSTDRLSSGVVHILVFWYPDGRGKDATQHLHS